MKNIEKIEVGTLHKIAKPIIFGDKRDEYIKEISKKILNLSLTRKDSHKYDEVGMLYYMDNIDINTVIYGKWNDKHKNCEIDVHNDFRYEEMTYSFDINTLIFVHNHPNNSNISFNDIMNLFEKDSIVAVIAVGNNGNLNFIFKNNKSTYIPLMVKIWKSIMNKNTDTEKAEQANKIYESIMKNPEKFGVTVGTTRRKI